jgi:hypothetical protein
MLEEAMETHQDMLRHVRAREIPEALEAANRFLELAEDLEQTPELRSLTIGTTGTWVQLKAALEPDSPELPAVYEGIYERYRHDDTAEAVVVALAALTARIHLLIKRGHKDQAVQDAERLARLYRFRPLSYNRTVAANQLLLAAYLLLAAQLPRSALALARAVVDALGDSDEPGESLLAAGGQTWVVITTMYSGQANPEVVVPEDLSELPEMSIDELRELSPVIGEAEKLQARGADAVKAIDRVLGRLQRTGQWDRAFITLLGLKVETVRELDQPDDLRAAINQFIDKCSGIEKWHAPEMVRQYQRELAEN